MRILDKWVGAPVGGGVTTFADLTDVDSSTKNGNSSYIQFWNWQVYWN